MILFPSVQVHYSLSYATPLLLARFSLPSGEPLPLSKVSSWINILSEIKGSIFGKDAYQACLPHYDKIVAIDRLETFYLAYSCVTLCN